MGAARQVRQSLNHARRVGRGAQLGEEAANRVGAVVFASPDIDLDGFSSSVQRIGHLARKIIVVTAANDRALAVSRWMAGGITRVGAAETAQLERMGMRVIDASRQGWGIINHDLFLSNAQLRNVIRGALDEPAGAPQRQQRDPVPQCSRRASQRGWDAIYPGQAHGHRLPSLPISEAQARYTAR